MAGLVLGHISAILLRNSHSMKWRIVIWSIFNQRKTNIPDQPR
jgi:hypothetical protein